jgi:peptidoglycan/LPS O-acetylase OafA/YrhL
LPSFARSFSGARRASHAANSSSAAAGREYHADDDRSAVGLLGDFPGTEAGVLQCLLEVPVLVLIGRRSYAMNLIHVLVLDVVERFQPAFLRGSGVLIVCVAYVLTLAGASMMYVAIERPCIAFGRQLSKRVAQRAPSGPQRVQ